MYDLNTLWKSKLLLKKMYNGVRFLCLWSWRRERKKSEANRNRLHLTYGA